MSRDRRDRDRAECPDCGRTVTVTRSGRLMSHRNTEGRTCVSAAWHERVRGSETGRCTKATDGGDHR